MPPLRQTDGSRQSLTLSAHLGPLNPAGQRQRISPFDWWHVPPLRHGDGSTHLAKESTAFSHKDPEKLDGQMQEVPLPVRDTIRRWDRRIRDVGRAIPDRVGIDRRCIAMSNDIWILRRWWTKSSWEHSRFYKTLCSFERWFPEISDLSYIWRLRITLRSWFCYSCSNVAVAGLVSKGPF